MSSVGPSDIGRHAQEAANKIVDAAGTVASRTEKKTGEILGRLVTEAIPNIANQKVADVVFALLYKGLENIDTGRSKDKPGQNAMQDREVKQILDKAGAPEKAYEKIDKLLQDISSNVDTKMRSPSFIKRISE